LLAPSQGASWVLAVPASRRADEHRAQPVGHHAADDGARAVRDAHQCPVDIRSADAKRLGADPTFMRAESGASNFRKARMIVGCVTPMTASP
jgi:hypothetical protein